MKSKFIILTFGILAIIAVAVSLPVLKKETVAIAVLPPQAPVATTTQPAPTPPTPPPPVQQSELNLGGCSSMVSTSSINFQTSTTPGWKAAILPLTGFSFSGYCLLYPSTWTPSVVGAGAMNMLITTNNSSSPYNGNTIDSVANNQILFIQAVQGNPPIDKADKVIVGWYENSQPSLLISPSETVIQKEVETVGGKQALFELSENGTTTINRYFLEDAGGVYMFQSTIDKSLANSTSYIQFLSTMKQIVSSTQFVR